MLLPGSTVVGTQIEQSGFQATHSTAGGVKWIENCRLPRTRTWRRHAMPRRKLEVVTSPARLRRPPARRRRSNNFIAQFADLVSGEFLIRSTEGDREGGGQNCAHLFLGTRDRHHEIPEARVYLHAAVVIVAAAQKTTTSEVSMDDNIFFVMANWPLIRSVSRW